MPINSVMFSEPLEQPMAVAEAPPPERILIVDDDKSIVEVLSHRLSTQGFEPLAAHTGADGLQRAREDRPSLILLDLRLPDTDGLSICRELVDSSDTWDIPVIIVTGRDDPDIVRRCRAAGCRFFVHKPYDPNALLILIRQALEDWM
ncbi:MAG: response regulator [Planctomycetaceae bacterium]|nr:response regulator [Planctomycetaceae bacterium]